MHRLVLIFCFVLIFSTPAIAEFSCTTEVKYVWKKPESSEVTAFWAAIEKKDAVQATALELVKKIADLEREKAYEGCIRRHQNLSGCIASKMSSFQETMRSLSFTARSKLEESIVKDCETDQGECQKVVVTDPKCEDLNPPEVSEESEEEDSSKKKKKR